MQTREWTTWIGDHFTDMCASVEIGIFGHPRSNSNAASTDVINERHPAFQFAVGGPGDAIKGGWRDFQSNIAPVQRTASCAVESLTGFFAKDLAEQVIAVPKVTRASKDPKPEDPKGNGTEVASQNGNTKAGANREENWFSPLGTGSLE